ncbi:hypothetical protein C8R47DRAFT_1248481 [Mycena vitilis]|nr:hypothetical protein C8R47DRAFT_1248481 [Mycena vitilis]
MFSTLLPLLARSSCGLEHLGVSIRAGDASQFIVYLNIVSALTSLTIDTERDSLGSTPPLLPQLRAAATHLANFGTASLWPLYLFFGNQSKWVRGKPRAGACHHIAYMPKLPDTFFDWFKDLTGTSPSAEVLTHCRRELMHAIWRLLLDGEFLEACKHGIVVECPDGVSRRFYFRVFTYSADYPEKVLLATIRNLGHCPCPRCLVTKDKLDQLGTIRDDKNRVKTRRVDDEGHRSYVQKARDWIHRAAKGIRSVKVEGLMSPKSWVPTANAFTALTSFGLSIFDMLVPDFMHEFELGVWKAVFTHLLRILMAYGQDTIQALNDRYRQIPTFGAATIRRFTDNAAAMKKLAARNFEDLLQCALPVFEDLLDEPHNKIVLDLLFTLAYWHSLAKLRMHTDFTVSQLAEVTTLLGRLLRYFKKVTCAAFATQELPKETAARGRRHANLAKKAAAAGTAAPKPAAEGKKTKTFNLETYKLHSLGDYTRTVPFFGTTDSYSTQPGELEHRRVKRYYARTNKNEAVTQMTQLERRESALIRLTREKQEAERIPPISTLENPVPTPPTEPETAPTRKRKRPSRAAPKIEKVSPVLDFADSESLPYTPPEAHFHISLSRNFYCHLPSWLADNEGDPALVDFLPKLKDHLLGRLLHPNWTATGQEFTHQEHAKLLIVSDRLYRHKVLRVNYTSYDVRRGQDSMNPRTHADILMLTPDDGTDNSDKHPFSYARVIGVFHVDVIHNIPGASNVAVSIPFLWVRHFRLDSKFKGGFKRKRLHRIEFIPDSDAGAFGFVNPDEVIRGSHLIPAFAHGPTEAATRASLARRKGEFDDWTYHYVNFFVDRDMFMRYLGGGVGHYQVPVPDEIPEDDDLEPEEDEEEDEPATANQEQRNPADSDDDNEGSGDDEDQEEPQKQDSGDEDSDEEGDPWVEDLDDDGDLGPEDGEGVADDSAAAEYGYDEL